MKHILKLSALLFLGFLMSFSAFPQQIPENNFYNINPFVVNPAAAGINGEVAAYLDYRDQWTGFNNGPKTMQFGIHALVSNAIGLGLKVSQQNHGVLSEFSIDVNYSHRLKISTYETIAFGLDFGIAQNRIDFDNIYIEDPSDPALLYQNLNKTFFHTGIGLHYNRKAMNIHVSVPLLYNSQYNKVFQTVFAFFSYDFMLLDKQWAIQPSLMYRYNDKDFHEFGVNIMVEWKNQLWFQAGFRSVGSSSIGAGIRFNNIGLGYSYDLISSRFSTAASSTHEIVLLIDTRFSLPKKRPLYKSTRGGYAN